MREEATALSNKKREQIRETRCRGEDGERNEGEEGVEAQMKGGGSHCAVHPGGTDII